MTVRLPEGSSVLSDRVGHLPARQVNPKARRNPFSKPVREVRVKLDSGKVLRILSNDLEAPAQQIADLYKRRWAIELFFRWVKQTLKIRHFLGTGENAVRIQVAVALIAFLLLRLAQATQSAIASAARFRPTGARQPDAPKTHRPPAEPCTRSTTGYDAIGSAMDLMSHRRTGNHDKRDVFKLYTGAGQLWA